MSPAAQVFVEEYLEMSFYLELGLTRLRASLCTSVELAVVEATPASAACHFASVYASLEHVQIW